MFKAIYAIEHDMSVTDVNKAEGLIRRLLSIKGKDISRQHVLNYIALESISNIDELISAILDVFDVSYENVENKIIYLPKDVDPLDKIAVSSYFKIKEV